MSWRWNGFIRSPSPSSSAPKRPATPTRRATSPSRISSPSPWLMSRHLLRRRPRAGGKLARSRHAVADCSVEPLADQTVGELRIVREDPADTAHLGRRRPVLIHQAAPLSGVMRGSRTRSDGGVERACLCGDHSRGHSLVAGRRSRAARRSGPGPMRGSGRCACGSSGPRTCRSHRSGAGAGRRAREWADGAGPSLAGAAASPAAHSASRAALACCVFEQARLPTTFEA